MPRIVQLPGDDNNLEFMLNEVARHLWVIGKKNIGTIVAISLVPVPGTEEVDEHIVVNPHFAQDVPKMPPSMRKFLQIAIAQAKEHELVCLLPDPNERRLLARTFDWRDLQNRMVGMN